MASNYHHNDNNPSKNIPITSSIPSIPRPGSQSGSYVPRSLQPQLGSYGVGTGHATPQMGGLSYTPQKQNNQFQTNPKPHNMAYSMQNGSYIHNGGQFNTAGGTPGSFRGGNDSPRLSFHRDNSNNNPKLFSNDHLQSSTFSLQSIQGNGSSGFGNALNPSNNNNNQQQQQLYSSQFSTTGSIRGGRESGNGGAGGKTSLVQQQPQREVQQAPVIVPIREN